MRTKHRISVAALAMSIVTTATFIPSSTPIAGAYLGSEAQAFQEVIPRGMGKVASPSGVRSYRPHGMRGGGGWGGGRGVAAGAAAGLVGGLLAAAITHSYAEDHSTGYRVDCFRVGCNEFHMSNVPGRPAVEIVQPPKLKRVNCKGGRCKPIKYGNYRLWPYTDGAGNNYAKVTDASGNPVNFGGGPGAQINGYTIIQ